jgi:transcriptional regulator with XRE-family HTH domain
MYPNLKLQMWRSGIRQNRLARTLQMDETILSRIVNGFRQPCPEMKAKIAAALNCDSEWLFEPVPDLAQASQPGLSGASTNTNLEGESPDC